MARKKLPLSKAKVNQVRLASLAPLEQELSKRSKALDEIKATPKLATERAKLLVRLLLASTAEEAELASSFFENLPKRLDELGKLMGLSPEDLHFASWDECAVYLKGKVIGMNLKTADVRKFAGGMEGRKWWFIGKILFERYIKYGPVRKFLDATAQAALESIKKEIKDNNSYKMVDIWYGLPPVKGDQPIEPISITKPFGAILAGMEFSLETAKGDKEYLDFGHVAFNKDGYWILPTPTEIKLPSAARKVANQFSQFMARMRDADKLVVTFEGSDLGKLQEQIGSDSVKLEIVGGRIQAQLDRNKLVFDPHARNQLVVKPASRTWVIVNKAEKSPNIDVDVSTTTKGGGFNFWKIQVDVSRAPFVKLYEAIFLGK